MVVQLNFDVLSKILTYIPPLESIELMIILKYHKTNLYKTLLDKIDTKFKIIKKYFNESILETLGGCNSLLNLPYIKVMQHACDLKLNKKQQKYPIQWGIDSLNRAYLSFRIIHPRTKFTIIETVFKRYENHNIWSGNTQILKIIPTTLAGDTFKQDNIFAYNINMLINNLKNNKTSLVSANTIYNPIIDDYEKTFKTNKITVI